MATPQIRPVRSILCAVDFSGPSDHALDHALALGAQLDARVEVVHVFQIPTYVLPDGVVLATPVQIEDIRASLQKTLDDLKAKRPAIAAVHLVEGVPFREIVDLAGRLDADLIVMGSHGRSGLNRLLIGSVAERVVRTAKVPVLTIHPPEKAKGG